ncbi:MAG: hypothetical protein A3J24_12635 [Deltaproteobacteria bacterium RIFCSPLOWO2_02_FULL_53_8]|nr:MAG: hypothetical protein A3J24_12635 [Deltaproteobacteria bacterium RIFCSPLOWO2_02_FULL_53_8]
MSLKPEIGSFAGTWTYRSLLNDPDVSVAFDNLEFGRGNIDIQDAPFGVFKGRIYGPGWELQLSGAINFGTPNVLRFQGRGVVGGEEWIYDYTGYYVPAWPNGIDQRPAIVGSIVRTIAHSSGASGTAPAGVVCSWYAVLNDPQP